MWWIMGFEGVCYHNINNHHLYCIHPGIEVKTSPLVLMMEERSFQRHFPPVFPASMMLVLFLLAGYWTGTILVLGVLVIRLLVGRKTVFLEPKNYLYPLKQ
jgi:hypothetical protein